MQPLGKRDQSTEVLLLTSKIKMELPCVFNYVLVYVKEKGLCSLAKLNKDIV